MSDLWNILAFLAQFTVGLAVVVVAVEAVTEILVSSSLLDIIGLRPWAAKKAIPPDADYSKVRWYHTALKELLTCGYCTSVWASMLTAWTLPGDYFGLLPWDNILVKIFLVHRLSNWLHVRYQLVRKGRVNTMDIELKLSGAVVHQMEVDDAREIPRGDGETGEEAGRPDLSAASGPLSGGHQAPAG